jgi:hypothetical protein
MLETARRHVESVNTCGRQVIVLTELIKDYPSSQSS